MREHDNCPWDTKQYCKKANFPGEKQKFCSGSVFFEQLRNSFGENSNFFPFHFFLWDPWSSGEVGKKLCLIVLDWLKTIYLWANAGMKWHCLEIRKKYRTQFQSPMVAGGGGEHQCKSPQNQQKSARSTKNFQTIITHFCCLKLITALTTEKGDGVWERTGFFYFQPWVVGGCLQPTQSRGYLFTDPSLLQPLKGACDETVWCCSPHTKIIGDNCRWGDLDLKTRASGFCGSQGVLFG